MWCFFTCFISTFSVKENARKYWPNIISLILKTSQFLASMNKLHQWKEPTAVLQQMSNCANWRSQRKMANSGLSLIQRGNISGFWFQIRIQWWWPMFASESLNVSTTSGLQDLCYQKYQHKTKLGTMIFWYHSLVLHTKDIFYKVEFMLHVSGQKKWWKHNDIANFSDIGGWKL